MNITKLAAIDIGSNAIRLLINYVYKKKNEQPIFNKTSIVRMPIRLGHDVFINGFVSDENIDRISDALQSFALMMKVYDVQAYRAYATSAMREAKNASKILKQVKERSDIQIEIIDGKLESELIFNTDLSSFFKTNKAYLYVDVGGGSTELTLLENGKVKISKSFLVGTVRLLENRVDENIFLEMREWIQVNVKQEIELIGAGGNINYVYKYSDIEDGKPLVSLYVKKQYKILSKLTTDERMQIYNMKPDRADVIVYALQIYSNIIEWSKAKKIHVPKIGLSDGMIRELYREQGVK